jgi:hypothetical protein
MFQTEAKSDSNSVKQIKFGTVKDHGHTRKFYLNYYFV